MAINNSIEKGNDGEVETSNVLRSKGRVLRTLYIPHASGIAQIDMLLINESGLFVIENKNYKAKIVGTDITKDWVAVYSRKRKYDFQNPVYQNYVHIMALMQVLERSMNPMPYIYNIVIFNDVANLDGVQSLCTYKVKDFIDKQFTTQNPYSAEITEAVLKPYIDTSNFMWEYHNFLLAHKGEKTSKLTNEIGILEDMLIDYEPRYEQYLEIVEKTRDDEIAENHYKGFR